MNLLISLRSELLKTRTASFYLTLIGAAVGPVMYLLNVLIDENEIDPSEKDPLNAIFKILSDMNGTALFPLFVILICTLLPQIEYRNNTWKQVFASPQTKVNVFLAKFMNVHLLMLVFLIATHLFMFLTIAGINFIKWEGEAYDASGNTYRRSVNEVSPGFDVGLGGQTKAGRMAVRVTGGYQAFPADKYSDFESGNGI